VADEFLMVAHLDRVRRRPVWSVAAGKGNATIEHLLPGPQIQQGDVVIQDGHLFGDGVNIAVGLAASPLEESECGGCCLYA
jgi:hypothetical protein